MIDARALLATHDILLMTLDSLRFDVARDAMAAGLTPNLTQWLPVGGWERRHSPGSFTYAAHHAFFAGFLPTPAEPGTHARHFALRFDGSRSTGPKTVVFDAPDIVSGLAARGHHTICVGGVGFFDKKTGLGSTLPSLFRESHWEPSLGVKSINSTRAQIRLALERLAAVASGQRVFLFVNVSATHHPTRIYVRGATRDSPETQQAALAYVDGELPALFDGLAKRGAWLCIVCSDHGTAFGDAGHHGHRLGHPCVWDVPYGEFILAAEAA